MAAVDENDLYEQFDEIENEQQPGGNTRSRVAEAYRNTYDTLKLFARFLTAGQELRFGNAAIRLNAVTSKLEYTQDTQVSPVVWEALGYDPQNNTGFEDFDATKPDGYYAKDAVKFVSFNNNLWKYVSDTPWVQANPVTPGSNGAVWAISSAGEASHSQNTDTGTSASMFDIGIGNLQSLGNSGRTGITLARGAFGGKAAIALNWQKNDIEQEENPNYYALQFCLNYTGTATDTWVDLGGGEGTPGGTETGAVQYRGADGKFTGDSNFIWDYLSKILELHGDSFIWRVNNGVPSGNAVVEFLANQLLAFRFGTGSQDYLVFRSAGTPAQISNVQRELNTSISCAYVESQEGAESTSATQIIVGSITLAEGEMVNAVIDVAAKTADAARCIGGTITAAIRNNAGTVEVFGVDNTAQYKSTGVGATAGFDVVAGSGTADIVFTGETGQTYAVKAYAVKFGRF